MCSPQIMRRFNMPERYAARFAQKAPFDQVAAYAAKKARPSAAAAAPTLAIAQPLGA